MVCSCEGADKGGGYTARCCQGAGAQDGPDRRYPGAQRGRRTGSPPQLGQRCPIAIAQGAQKVHS